MIILSISFIGNTRWHLQLVPRSVRMRLCVPRFVTAYLANSFGIRSSVHYRLIVDF